MAGRVEPGQARPRRPASVNVIGKCSSLADAANSPRPTAAAAAASAAAASAASAAAPAAPAASTASAASATSGAASATSATASATSGKLFAEPGCSGVLLVEDIERPQADVGDFLLIESDFVTRCVTRCDVARRHIRCRSGGSCGCAARQRQRHADDSQHRYGFLPTLSLRSLLRLWHGRPPRMPSSECSTPVALFVRLCKGTLFVRLCKGTLQGRIRTLAGHSLQAAYRRTERSTSSSTTQHPVCSSTSRRRGLPGSSKSRAGSPS
jgi:hypothetical protein